MARRDLNARLERIEHAARRPRIDPAAEAAQYGQLLWRTPDGYRGYATTDDDTLTVITPGGPLTYTVELEETA